MAPALPGSTIRRAFVSARVGPLNLTLAELFPIDTWLVFARPRPSTPLVPLPFFAPALTVRSPPSAFVVVLAPT